MTGQARESDEGQRRAPGETFALWAAGAVLALTGFLWAFALWPLPTDTPSWVFRARTACFGSASTGLPDASGWLVLTLQPALMLAIVAVAWGRAVAQGLGGLWSRQAGRATLVAVGVALVAGTAAAGWRVANATPPANSFAGDDTLLPDTYPRLNRPAPALRLADQTGSRLDLADFQGRPVLITFAYAHCTTVCPVVVHDVREARRQLGGLAPAVVVITLDPARDVPSRLPAIARQWSLGPEEFVLSGPVAEVEATLDGWNIPRVTDPTTGDVTHPRLVYLIDREGRIAYATAGGVRAIVDLARRL